MYSYGSYRFYGSDPTVLLALIRTIREIRSYAFWFQGFLGYGSFGFNRVVMSLYSVTVAILGFRSSQDWPPG